MEERGWGIIATFSLKMNKVLLMNDQLLNIPWKGSALLPAMKVLSRTGFVLEQCVCLVFSA